MDRMISLLGVFLFLFLFPLAGASGQQAKLVMVTIAGGMPEGADFQVKPMGYEYGVTYHFVVEGENFVSLQKDAVMAEGWEAGQFPKVSEDGVLATFSVRRKGDFLGAAELPAVEGTVAILTASKVATKKVKLEVGGGPAQVGGFTVELIAGKGGGGGGLLGTAGGVRVVGNHAAIKSIVLLRDGGEVESRSSTWNDRAKTFGFEGVGGAEEVVIRYWEDLEPRRVRFRK